MFLDKLQWEGILVSLFTTAQKSRYGKSYVHFVLFKFYVKYQQPQKPQFSYDSIYNN